MSIPLNSTRQSNTSGPSASASSKTPSPEQIQAYNDTVDVIEQLNSNKNGIVLFNPLKRDRLGSGLAQIWQYVDHNEGYQLRHAADINKEFIGQQMAMNPGKDIAHPWKDGTIVVELTLLKGTPLRQVINGAYVAPGENKTRAQKLEGGEKVFGHWATLDVSSFADDCRDALAISRDFTPVLTMVSKFTNKAPIKIYFGIAENVGDQQGGACQIYIINKDNNNFNYTGTDIIIHSDEDLVYMKKLIAPTASPAPNASPTTP